MIECLPVAADCIFGGNRQNRKTNSTRNANESSYDEKDIGAVAHDSPAGLVQSG